MSRYRFYGIIFRVIVVVSLTFLIFCMSMSIVSVVVVVLVSLDLEGAPASMVPAYFLDVVVALAG